jgi:diguanylate cyclase (GGDEF)-like protein
MAPPGAAPGSCGHDRIESNGAGDGPGDRSARESFTGAARPPRRARLRFHRGARTGRRGKVIRALRLSPAVTAREFPQSWLRALLAAAVLVFGLYALTPGRAQPPVEDLPLAVRLVPLPDAEGRLPELSRDGSALRLGVSAETRQARAELRFVLPPRTPDSPHWVVWVPRVPVESLQFRIDGAWDGGRRMFMAPDAEEGPMPAGYLYRLPSTWEGEIRLELRATALRETSVRPQIVSEALAANLVQKTTILNTLAYASLFTLGLVTLALFFASRDRSFFAFFVFCASGELLLAAYDGHLNVLDPFGALIGLGGAGLHAISLLFVISALRIVSRYTELAEARPALAERIDRLCLAVFLVAGILLAWRQTLDAVSAWLVPALWFGCGALVLVVLVDAGRRRVPMAPAVLVSVLGVIAAVVLWEASARGWIALNLWTLYGYQMALVVCAAMVGVGLISRISKYREQRDREQRARADSERRMYREAVRSELLTALQMSLRSVGEEEIQPMAMRLLLDHLRRIVPVDNVLAVIRGYHGRDTLAAHPGGALDALVEHVTPRLPNLRQQLAINVDVQQPVSRGEGEIPVAIEAAISLPVRAPAWGTLVMERNGATVFHPDELSIARELARIAMMQIDEAFTALHLRHTAEVDSLTGALNRRSLDQTLARTFQHAHRTGLPLSVLFVDIDHFKAINDQRGHACGDQCLREIARLIGAQLGEEDVFGRYGGEEFLVVLPGRQTEMARAIAEQMRAAIESADVAYQGQPLRMTVSIGVATRLTQEAQPQPAVERADKALYAAKRAGRNRVNVAPAVFASRPAPA